MGWCGGVRDGMVWWSERWDGVGGVRDGMVWVEVRDGWCGWR